MKRYLAALDDGNGDVVCPLMAAKERARQVAQAVADDTIRRGGDCASLVEAIGEFTETSSVTSSDAKVEELSNRGAKARVRVSYADPMYTPYVLILIKKEQSWLVAGEVD